MELSSLSENIVIERFERNGEMVTLEINIDAIVPGFDDELLKRLAGVIERMQALEEDSKALQAQVAKAVKQQEKVADGKRVKKAADVKEMAQRLDAIRKQMEPLEREIYAERLTCPISLPDGSTTCLLKGWDTTVDGVAIAASKENLMRLPAKTVQVIWSHVESRLNTVKKTAENPTTQNQMIQETMETGSQEFTIPLNAPVM